MIIIFFEIKFVFMIFMHEDIFVYFDWSRTRAHNFESNKVDLIIVLILINIIQI